MALPFYNWSRTAASNATADATVNWAEGQAPSSVNDSARAMMASTAAFRDDISGGIVTGGTSSAYTVTSYQVFDSLAHLGGQMVCFVPHVTNAGACTLNVDGLGNKPLRLTTSVDCTVGMLLAGTPYTVTYNASDAVFYLNGVIAYPQSAIPLGACLPYWGTTSPNIYFALPLGQAISRSAYSGLFSLIGTTHGVGDGSTTFNLPDMGGRTLYGKEATATRLTSAVGGIDGGTLGASGGAQVVTLVTANLPPYTPSGTVGGGSQFLYNDTGTIDAPATTPTGVNIYRAADKKVASFVGTAQGGTSTAVQTLPPGIVCNFIMRIL